MWELSIEAAGVGSFDWDLTTGVLTWDDRLREQFGYDEQTFTRTIDAFNARLHPGDRERVGQALAVCIATVGEYEAEYRVVRPDGTTRWISARGRAVPGPDGGTARVVGATLDVTATRAGEARVAGVLEEMSAAFFSLDRDWRFGYVNAEAERLLGRSRRDLLGRTVWELLPATVGSVFETEFREAVTTGRTRFFEAHYPAPLDSWFELRAHPGAEGLSVYFLDVGERRRATELSDAVLRRHRLVGDVATELAEHLDAELAVARLAQLLVPELADWCLVTLVDDEEGAKDRRNLRDVGWWHVEESQRPLVEQYARSRLSVVERHAFLMRALDTGQTQVITNATESIRSVLRQSAAADALGRLAPEHSVILPLRARGRTVGLLSLFRGAARGALSELELATTAEVAARAGLALDNSRLYRQQLNLAERLQRALLTDPPANPLAEIWTHYTPAAEAAQVGGDWYDAFNQPDGGLVVAIGDVAGHDATAAAQMGQIRTAVRTLGAADLLEPVQVMRRVDRTMETLQLQTTASAVVARLRPVEAAGSLLEWSNAGHLPPMLIRPDHGVTRLTGPANDLLLGIHPGLERHGQALLVAPGATLLLYSDGLVERRHEAISESLARLERTLLDLAPQELALPELGAELLRRLLPQPPGDDVAMVALRVH